MFQSFLQDHGQLNYVWECLVFDEAHRLKNDLSILHSAVAKVTAQPKAV